MKERKAEAVWRGKLKDGNGTVSLGSGLFESSYSFRSRFEEGAGTNPEELIGAAHAGCFSMALANILEEEGYSPREISTAANVNLDEVEGDFTITGIALSTEGSVPDIDDESFEKLAKAAKENCPVSKALAGTEITLEATLL
ncbi:MAG: OsmC family protein [Candidatus Bipolaricaulota bacterium]|nr:OsmC family protein [Candidatus Bipolaricaulota bacterium]MBS3791993.1 OsmC family protein [Candidatus Bipolaricaulota bacterium]